MWDMRRVAFEARFFCTFLSRRRNLPGFHLNRRRGLHYLEPDYQLMYLLLPCLDLLLFASCFCPASRSSRCPAIIRRWASFSSMAF